MIDTSTTLIRVVEQLTKITNSLEQMAAASNKQSNYQAQADKYREDYQKRQAAPQTEKESKDSKTGFLKSLGDKIFGLSAPGTLKSNEQQRFTNIAKCFNAVMHVDAISKSIDRLRESNEEAIEQSKRESLFSRLTPKTAKTEDKRENKGSVLGSLLKWGLIAAALKLLWDLATAPLNALSGLFEFLSKWSLVGLIKLIKFKIMMFFNAITYPLKALYKLLAGDSIDSAIKTLTGKMGEQIGNFKTVMFGVFEGLGDKISKKLGEWIGRFKNFIFEAFEGMGERISKMMGSAQRYLMGKFPKLTANLSSIRSVVSDSIDSIINWVKKPFQGISTAIMEFFAKKGGSELATVAATKLEGSIFKKIFQSAFKFLSKLGMGALKKVPGIGAFISFYLAYGRYKQGNYKGALIEVLSGLASTVPVIGTALSIGLDMLNVWRDMTGKTAEEVRQNGPTNNWFTKMVDGFGQWASENLYNWPYVGSLIRSIEHFEAGKWKEGFISLANAFPLVGGILAIFDIKETESQAGRGTGNIGESLKSAWKWLKNNIFNMPLLGNVTRAFDNFFSGNFADGLSELGLGGIINAIKNFKFEMPSFGDVGDMLSNAIKFLYDSILDLPIIRNIIQSIKYAASGEWKKAALELLPDGVVSWFKKISGDEQDASNKQSTPATNPQSNQIKFDQASTNNLTPQSQKLQLAGLSDLQESLLAMSKQEINLLAEQRNLIKQTNDILTLIYNTSVAPADQQEFQQIQPGGQTPSTGAPSSMTREAFQGGRNIMSMGLPRT